MQKSVREARTETSWLKPDDDYEEALEQFIRSILSHPPFLKYIEEFIDPVMKAGAFNSLSVLTLKILNGTVPDIYQGTEIWDFSLVDPDNRRPVNFKARRDMQMSINTLDRNFLLRHLMDNWQDGGDKAMADTNAFKNPA